jgi:carboxypeptidase C (cathepsin A)
MRRLTALVLTMFWAVTSGAAQVKQVTHVDGKALAYTLTVDSLPVKDESDSKIGEMVYTAYTIDGSLKRPVTFAINGGPGASSVFLQLGAIGPRRVSVGGMTDTPSDTPTLVENPGTWLDFTDLVFVDPIGTGYSRSLLPDGPSHEHFWGARQDIEYLARFIQQWLNQHGRLTSPTYLAGESYGGYRVPVLIHELQTRTGLGIRGAILISPALDSAQEFDPEFSPLPWMVTLPSMAAAHLERAGQLSAATIAPAIEYARNQYLRDLMAGRSDPDARERMVARVSELTGLDPEWVRRSGGRVEVTSYVRERDRDRQILASQLDPALTLVDPFPAAPEQRIEDPVFVRMLAPTTSAMMDLATRVVGWKSDARYIAFNFAINSSWEDFADGREPQLQSVAELRQSLSADPRLQVLIVHGWSDINCPFLASQLIVDAMPSTLKDGRISVNKYPGGHMFYERELSRLALRDDVRALYQKSLETDKPRVRGWM